GVQNVEYSHSMWCLTTAVSGAGPTPQQVRAEGAPGVHSTALVSIFGYSHRGAIRRQPIAKAPAQISTINKVHNATRSATDSGVVTPKTTARLLPNIGQANKKPATSP